MAFHQHDLKCGHQADCGHDEGDLDAIWCMTCDAMQPVVDLPQPRPQTRSGN